jgi:hypothetical protein
MEYPVLRGVHVAASQTSVSVSSGSNEKQRQSITGKQEYLSDSGASKGQ